MEKSLFIKTIRIAEKSDKWSIEKLQAYQFERLKALLQFAYDHSPFYKRNSTRSGSIPRK